MMIHQALSKAYKCVIWLSELLKDHIAENANLKAAEGIAICSHAAVTNTPMASSGSSSQLPYEQFLHALNTHMVGRYLDMTELVKPHWEQCYSMIGDHLLKLFMKYDVYQQRGASFVMISGHPQNVTEGKYPSMKSQEVKQQVFGPHQYMYNKPSAISLDRVFGRMSFRRWLANLFPEMCDTFGNCIALKELHEAFCRLKLEPLVKYTCGQMNPTVGEAIPRWKIGLFIKRMYNGLNLKEMFGISQNSKAFLTKLKKFFTMNRASKVTTSFLTRGIKFSECGWLRMAESRLREPLFNRFIMWIIRYFCQVLAHFFYVTEGRETKKKPQYFWHSEWQQRVKDTVRGYQFMGVLSESQLAGVATWKLRFLPGPKLRPILRVNHKTQSKSAYFQLKDIVSCLKFLLKTERLGVADTEMLPAMRKFVEKNRDMGGPIYYVKGDISKCYDSINRTRLLNIISDILCEYDAVFRVWMIRCIIYSHELKQVKSRCLYQVDPIKHGYQSLTFSQICEKLKKDQHINSAVFLPVKLVIVTPDKILDTISSHLGNATVQVPMPGNPIYSLSSGIPQGSVLSSALCDIYYGSMEKQYLNVDHRGDLYVRHTDDYLYLTHCQQRAYNFMTALLGADLHSYNCTINKRKTTTNAPCDDSSIDTQDFATSVHWCQYIIYIEDCSVHIPSYSRKDVENATSVDTTVKPLQLITRLLQQQVRVIGNPLYLDHTVNSIPVILNNCCQVFKCVGDKFCYLASHLLDDAGVDKNLNVWMNVLLSCVSTLIKVARHHCTRNDDAYGLNPVILKMLYLQTLIAIFNQRAELNLHNLVDLMRTKLSQLRLMCSAQ